MTDLNAAQNRPAGAVPTVDSIGTSPTTVLAQRLGLSSYALEVVEIVDLAPSMRRLRVGATSGTTLEGFSSEAGQDLMIDIANLGDRTIRRRYTIRRFDPAAQLIDIDVVLHGEGPAARWAADATPGTQLDAIGPRGKVTLEPHATWHLFVGDETFAPAVAAMLEALDPSQQAVAILEVDSAADAKAIQDDLGRDDLNPIHFVERNSNRVGQSPALLGVVAGTEFPSQHVMRTSPVSITSSGPSAAPSWHTALPPRRSLPRRTGAWARRTRNTASRHPTAEYPPATPATTGVRGRPQEVQGQRDQGVPQGGDLEPSPEPRRPRR